MPKMCALRDKLSDYYNYRIFGPRAYREIAEAAAHAGEFLAACEKMPTHRLRFSLVVDVLAEMVEDGRGNLEDIYRAQRLGKKLLDFEDMQIKDYTKLVTHPCILKAFEHDHKALDFFLGLSALEIEEEGKLGESRGFLTYEQKKHNEKIEALLSKAKEQKDNENIKSLMREKITPFFLNNASIKQAAKVIHDKLCHENCCDGHRDRLGSLAYN